MERRDWMLGLKVGDVVCNCRHQHRPVVKIEDIVEPTSDFLAVTTWALAMFSLNLAAFMRDSICQRGGGMVVDRIVYFADGTRCHATRCLDPPENCLHQ